MIKPTILLEPETLEARKKISCSKKIPKQRDCSICEYSKPEERCIYRVSKILRFTDLDKKL